MRSLVNLFFLFCLQSFCAAATASFFAGDWSDSEYEAKKIGAVHIEEQRISIGKNLVYATQFVETSNFNGSRTDIFKVTGSSSKKDPFGCGKGSRVTYIYISDLGSDETSKSQSIYINFYSGTVVPTPEAFSRDKHLDDYVCLMHALDRPIRSE